MNRDIHPLTRLSVGVLIFTLVETLKFYYSRVCFMILSFCFLKQTFKAFAPSIIEKDHGHFVSVASLAGYFGNVRQTEYAASKFAVVGFEECMFMEFELHKSSGVHSTIIHPFYMNTGMFKGVEER